MPRCIQSEVLFAFLERELIVRLICETTGIKRGCEGHAVQMPEREFAGGRRYANPSVQANSVREQWDRV